jgi:hypothetical protein
VLDRPLGVNVYERMVSSHDTAFGASDIGVRAGQEILVGCGQDIVSQGCQCGFQVPGEILIQLELHSSVPVFQTLS